MAKVAQMVDLQNRHRDWDLSPFSKNQRLPMQYSLPSPAKVSL